MSRLTLILLVLSLFAVTGCMSAKDPEQGEPSAEQLKLPPGLTPEKSSTAMAIPPPASARANQPQGTSEPVLGKPDNVTLHRDGRVRWLEVQAPPSQVWGQVEDFVKQRKLEMARNNSQLGIMETAWRYRAEPLSRDIFAPSAVDRAAANVADRYLIRLEAGIKPGTTEVFVAQRRVARDEQGEWRLRDADPFQEAELMRALLVSLGGDTATSARLPQDDISAVQPQLQQLEDGMPALILRVRFFEAWRRIGMALDRAGFTVVDRDRSARHYFVRYDKRAELGPKDKGFWDTVAFWRNDIPDTVEKYRLDLTEVNNGTQVTVRRFDDTPASQDIAGQILGLVEGQLR